MTSDLMSRLLNYELGTGLRREAADEIARLTGEVARLHERLEDSHYYCARPDDPDGPLIRVNVKPGSIPDGIACRDSTIELLDAEIALLTRERDALFRAAEALVDFHNLPRAAQRPDVWQLRMNTLARVMDGTRVNDGSLARPAAPTLEIGDDE